MSECDDEMTRVAWKGSMKVVAVFGPLENLKSRAKEICTVVERGGTKF